MNENKTNINWYPGHMAKTKREIQDKINLIDVVYEVIDARMPISSKIVDIDNVIKNKKTIIIMTKYDMCDKNESDKFIKLYEEKGNIVIPVDLINNINVNKILKETEIIQKELNEQRKLKGMKPRAIRALVVGVPNVGKSTLINRLVGKKATVTGDRPGVTKSLGWIRVNKDIELLDSPGILWPKIDNQTHAYNLASLSSIKEEILNKQDICIYIINTLKKYYPDNLLKRYSLNNLDIEFDEMLDLIGKKRGALIKGGLVDYDKVYDIVIRDLKEGLLGCVTFDKID